jgi:hypothetical protein
MQHNGGVTMYDTPKIARAEAGRARRTRVVRNDHGSALLVVMAAAAILFVIAAAVVGVVVFQQTQQAHAQAVVRATALAQEGMEVYLSALRDDPSFWDSDKHPRISGGSGEDTWTVAADSGSGTIRAVGHDGASGVLHVIVAEVGTQAVGKYVIFSGAPISLGNGGVTIDGRVRGNSTITLLQNFTQNGSTVDAVAPSLGDISPSSYVRSRDTLGSTDFAKFTQDFASMKSAAWGRPSFVTTGVPVAASKPLFFERDPGFSWWGPTEDKKSSDVHGLVGVGIDLANETDPSKGVFNVRSVWTPYPITGATPADKLTVTDQQFADFAAQDPTWYTRSARPGDPSAPMMAAAALNPNGDNVVYVGGDLDVYVKGEYFSSMTIFTPNDIYIIGSVTRAATAPTGTVLGLVAGGNIYICSGMPTAPGPGRYAARPLPDGTTPTNGYTGRSYTRGSKNIGVNGEISETMPNDVTIQAAMMAVGGAIVMDPQDPNSLDAMRPTKRGTLTILGSLISNQGLPGPNFAAAQTALYGGFDHTYIGRDPVLENNTPPQFPAMGESVLYVSSWEEYTTSQDPNAGLAFPDHAGNRTDPPGAGSGGSGDTTAPVDAGDHVTPSTRSNVRSSYVGTAVITLSVSDAGASTGDPTTYWMLNDDPTVHSGRSIEVPPSRDNEITTWTVTYWSKDAGNPPNEEAKQYATFVVRGRDTLSAETHVADTQDRAKVLDWGYGSVVGGDPPYVVHGEFIPEFTARDVGPAGLGVQEVVVYLDGLKMGNFPGDTASLFVPVPSYPTTRVFEYYSIDKAGNREESRYLTFKQYPFDTTPPTTTHDAGIGLAATQTIMFAGDARIHLTATDNIDGQGVRSTFYRIDGGVWQESSGTVSMSKLTTVTVPAPPSGSDPVTHTVYFYSVDAATTYGRQPAPNSEIDTLRGIQSVTFVVWPSLWPDTTRPVTTSDATTTPYVGPATITLTPRDDGGIAQVYWQVDDTTVTAGTSILVAAPLTGSVQHHIDFWAIDLAFNEELPHKTATITVTPERTPPETFAHNEAQYAGPAQFQLTAKDNDGGSGVRETAYRVDSGAWTTSTPAPPLGVTMVFVSGDGTHTVDFYSTDNAGNKEVTRTSTPFRIDTTPPVTTADAVAEYLGVGRINLTATDAGTGVATTYWRTTGTGTAQTQNPILLGPGTWDVEYWSVDNAGNLEVSKWFHAHVTAAPDTSGPESYDDVPASRLYKAGTNPPVLINLYSWDVQSGVDKMYYKIDGGDQAPFAGKGNPPSSYQFTLGASDGSQDGTHSIEYWAKDKAGNVETTHHVKSFRIDTILPVTTCSAGNGSTYWGPQSFTLRATDSGSGVKETYYSLDGGVRIKATAAYVPAPSNGSTPHTIRFWSIDNAGNVEAEKMVEVTIRPSDTIAPTTRSAMDSTHAGRAIIALTAFDNVGGSGVAFTKYILSRNGVAGLETTGTMIELPGSGSYTIEFWSKDYAGNTETPHNFATYVVDFDAPVTRDDVSTYYKAPAVIHLTATDADSSVANTFWRLGSGAITTGTPPVSTVNVASAGVYSLQYWSVDIAGNVEATKTKTFTIDMTAPVTTSDAVTEYYGSPTEPAVIMLSASDEVGGSGLDGTYYKVDSSTAATVTGTSISIAGPVSGAPVVHTLYYWSVDRAGNREVTRRADFTVGPMAAIDFSNMTPAEGSTCPVRNPSVAVTGQANSSTITSATAKIDGVSQPVALSFPFVVTTSTQTWVSSGYYGSYQEGHGDGDQYWWWAYGWIDTSHWEYTTTTDVDYSKAIATFPASGLLDGTHQVSFTFTSSTLATKTKRWSFTVAAPADTLAPVTSSDAAATYRVPAVITLTAVDEVGGTGVRDTYYKVDTNATQTGTAPRTVVSVSGLGSHTLQYWSYDRANNKETTRTATFIIDSIAPTTTDNAASSYSGAATITLTAVDNSGGSGVKKTTYLIDGVAGSTGLSATGGGTTYPSGSNTVVVFTSSGTLSVSSPVTGATVLVVGGGGGGANGGGGGGGVRTGTMDLAGTMSVVVGAGGTAGSSANPYTSLAGNGGNSSIGSLTAIGGGAGGAVNNSGCAAGGSGGGGGYSWGQYSGASGTAGQGFAGGNNLGGWPTYPTGSPLGYDPSGGGGGAGAVGGNGTTTASGSGGAGVTSSISGSAVVYGGGGGGGTDVGTKPAGSGGSGGGGAGSAGGSGAAGTANRGGGGGGGLGNNGAYSGGAGGTGVVIISFPTSALSLSGATFTIASPTSGPPVSHTVRYWSEDNAGNVEATKSVTFSVSIAPDNTPPTTTDNAAASYPKPATITLTAVDNPGGWGVAYTRYQLDATSGVWTTGNTPSTGNTPGTHRLYYYSVDSANNTETIKSTQSYTIAADNTPPVTTSNARVNGLYEGPDVITLTATDVGWGVDKTYYKLDGGLTQTGTSVTVTAPVDLTVIPHTLQFWSVDLATNKETTKSVSYSASGIPTGMTFTEINPARNSFIRDRGPTITVAGDSDVDVLGAYATVDGIAKPAVVTFPYGTPSTTQVWVSDGYWGQYQAGHGDGDQYWWWAYGWIDTSHWETVTTTITDTTKAFVSIASAGLADGPHTVIVTFNLAGSTQGRTSWTFNVDTIAPTTTSDAKASYQGTATILLTATDNTGGSGVAQTKYRIGTGADTVGNTIVVPPPAYGSASPTVYYWSTDVAGNIENVVSKAFTQSANPDTIPPTTTSNAVSSYTAPSTITLTAVDNPGGWGIAYTMYQLTVNGVPGAVTTVTTSITSVPTGGNGNNRLEFWAMDRANNVESPHKVATYTVAADTTPPTTTSDAAASYTGDAHITLTAVDNPGGWGVDYTMYRIDDATAVRGTYITVPALAVGSQVHHIDFWSVDKVPNTEAVKTATFTVNAVPAAIVWSEWTPGIESAQRTVPSVSIAGDADFNVTGVTATLTRQGGSAVAQTVNVTFPYGTTTTTQQWVVSSYWGQYQAGHGDGDQYWYWAWGWIDNSHWEYVNTTVTDYTKALATFSPGSLVDGYYTARFTFTVASGAASSTSWNFWIDNVPPTTSSNATSTYVTNAAITLTPSDPGGCGVSSTGTFYSVQDGAWQTGTSINVPGPSSGSWVRHIDFYSVDRATNTETPVKTASFTINATADNTPPTTTSDVKRWYNSAASVITFTATDNPGGWGVDRTQYRLNKDNAGWGSVVTANSLLTNGGEGNYSLEFWSYDKAGNKEATKTAIFGVDMTPPVTTSSAVPIYTAIANINLSATDNLSGVASTKWTLDDGAAQTGNTISVTGPTGGSASHHIDFWSVDVATNVETPPKRADFRIDAVQAPMDWSAETPAPGISINVRNPTVSVRGHSPVDITGATATLTRPAGAAVSQSVSYTWPLTTTGTSQVWVSSGYWGSWQEGHGDGDQYWWWVYGWIDTSHYETVTTTITDYHDLIASFSTADLPDGGPYTIEFVYTVAGGGQARHSWTFLVNGPDNIKPTTTSDAATSYTGTATITLTAVDNPGGVGVRETHYTVDGGATQNGLVITVAPPAWGVPAAHWVTYWSIDYNNNTEVATRKDFTVAPMPDSIAPSTSTNATTTYTGAGSIILTAVDNPGGWGVDKTYYKLDGSSVFTQGTTPVTVSFPAPVRGSVLRTLWFYSTDRVPNTEITKSVTFTVNATPDNTPPVTTITASTRYQNPGTITLTAVDNVGGWGVQYTKYILTKDGVAGPETTYVGPFSTGDLGVYSLQYWSVDWANKTEVAKTHSYVVDRTPPVTTSSAVATYTVTANITLSAVDPAPNSGILSTWYKIDGATTYQQGTSISIAGPAGGAPVPHYVMYYSIDQSNNTETATRKDFVITATTDTVAPVTTSNCTTFYPAPSVITLYPTDGGWGVASTWYILDGAAAVSGVSVPTGGAAGSPHRLEYWSIDRANNIETHKVATYTIDATPPTTTSNAQPSYTGTATITLFPQDDAIGSGVRYTYYKVDDGSQQSGTTIQVPPPSSLSAVHHIDFHSVDWMNNTEADQTATFTINANADIWPPVTTPLYSATYSKPGTFTLSATDIGWGLHEIDYFVNGGPVIQGYHAASGGTMSATCSTSTGIVPGTYTVEYWSTDQQTPVNNVEGHRTFTFTLLDDTTAPVTTSNARVSPDLYTGPATISLTATDTGWGVRDTHFRIDGGAATTGTVINIPDTLTGIVSHTIQFWSVDCRGNVETTKSATFDVKAAGADMTFSGHTPAKNSTIATSNATIRIAAAANAAITTVTMQLDGVSVLPGMTASGNNATATFAATDLSNNATHRVDVTFTRADGRQSSDWWQFVVSYQTDFVAPTTTNNVPTTTAGIPEYFISASVSLIATDTGGSGVDYTRYKVDSSAWTSGTAGGGALVLIDGPVSGGPVSHTITYFSADRAGNKEATRSVTFSIAPRDLTPPTTTDNHQAFYRAPDTIRLTAADNVGGKGVASIFYRLDSASSWTTVAVEPGFEITTVGTGGSGTHVLDYYSIDRATPANKETTKTVSYTIDTVAPITSSDATATYQGSAVIHLSADDQGGSGIYKTYYTLDDGGQVDSTIISLAGPSSGSQRHHIDFWSVDNVGNQEIAKTANFEVGASPDILPPTTTSDVKATYPVPSLIKLTANDTGWGVDKTWYKLDSDPWTVATEWRPSCGLELRTGGAGSHTLLYYSVDKGGNKETTTTKYYTVTGPDITPPVTSCDATPSFTYTGAHTFRLSTNVDDSGVTPVTYSKLDTGPVNTGLSVFVPGPHSGTRDYTIYFWSVDINGQSEVTKSVTFSIQHNLAAITFGTPSPLNGSTGNPRNPTIAIAATSAVQSIASVTFEFDGSVKSPAVSINGRFASMTYAASGLAPGMHTAVAMFTDVVGASATTTWTFTVSAPVDNTPPVTSVEGTATVFRGTATFRLIGVDEVGGSGVVTTQYWIDSSSAFAGTPPTTTVSYTTQGLHTLKYRSIDRDNNVEATKTLSFNIDGTAPTTGSDASDSYSGDAVITLLPSDGAGGSGIAATYFHVDDGPVQSGVVVTVPAPASGSAYHTVYFWSVDVAGNTELQKSVDVIMWPDATPPVTTCDAVSTYTQPSVITLTATDEGGSGVAHTYYILTAGGVAGPQTAGTMLGTGGTGSYTLEYWSVDGRGNIEAHHTVGYTVAGNETTPPSTTSDAQLSYPGPATIHLTATDTGGSGVAHTYYRLDGGTRVESTLIMVTGAASHSLKFWSVDWAGNIEATKTADFTIVDYTPPVTSSDALTAYEGTATVSLTATDTESGVRATYYRIDGGSAQPGSVVRVAPPASGGPASHTVAFWSVDNIGNTETQKSATFTVAKPADGIPPTTTHDGVAPYSYTGQATISLTATDNAGGSGVKKTWYRLDGGVATNGTTIVVPPPASAPGVTHSIVYWSEDMVGNVEAEKTYTFTVNPVVVSGNASLRFRWGGRGNANLHVENSVGTWIAAMTVSGSGSQLSWDLTVPAGQSYKLVCDYLYDLDTLTSYSNRTSWSYELAPFHTPLLDADIVTWNY